MRRALAVTAFALLSVASFAPVGTASASSCDIAQNCVCHAVNYVYTTATGEPLLACA